MPEFVLPEFTRSLRALAVPSAPDSDHDRIFGPLIRSRAAASKMSRAEGQVAAFDAERLEREWRAAIAALAAARHPRSAPDARALVAELDVLGQPLWLSLSKLKQRASAVVAESGEARRLAWDAWVESVQLVFNAADDWWGAAVLVLGESGGPRRSFLRRIFRGGG